MNNSASFWWSWESFLAFHFEQCSKPFTPYRLWFKILIRKHFKNNVVAHLGCSLSSPTPRCVRRPACAVANKALLGLWQNGWNPESMLCWSILWMFVEYLLALLCRCIFCCWVSIWLRMFGPLRAVGPFNRPTNTDSLILLTLSFLIRIFHQKCRISTKIPGRICWTPPSTFEAPDEVLTELNKKHTAKASPASWGGENTNELIIYCTYRFGRLVVWKSARICRLETQTTYQWTLWWKECYES